MKKILYIILLTLFSKNAISNDWELSKMGLNYNKAINQQILLPNNTLNNVKIHLLISKFCYLIIH